MMNSLSQLTLKMASPGVPDIYQGSEVWDLNLVDPDNRRPVDFAARQQKLADICSSISQRFALLRQTEYGDSNCWRLEDRSSKAIRHFARLGLRRRQASLFLRGEYQPLAISGSEASNIVAFARKFEGNAVDRRGAAAGYRRYRI